MIGISAEDILEGDIVDTDALDAELFGSEVDELDEDGTISDLRCELVELTIGHVQVKLNVEVDVSVEGDTLGEIPLTANIWDLEKIW